MERRPGGDQIREARRRAGLTQAELARRMRTGQSAIARWEAGHRSPTFETVERALARCGFQLETVIRPHVHAGATRAAIRRALALPPAARLELIGAEGRNLLELDAARR